MFLKISQEHLSQSLFFNRLAGLRPKKRLWHRCFPVNFAKFLRTPFLQNNSGRLLLVETLSINRVFCFIEISSHFLQWFSEILSSSELPMEAVEAVTVKSEVVSQ